MSKEEEDEQSSVLEDFRFDWWRGFEKMWTIAAATEYCFGVHEPRYFSSMLSSMPKGEIFSMNVDAMKKTVFVIDDNIVISLIE